MTSFEDFGLDNRILKAVGELGYKAPTQIQEKCIACIMKGEDCVAQSSTGSGKTAGFGLPVLQRLERGKGVQFIVLTPTRELCIQVRDALASYSKYLGVNIAAVYGGASMQNQIRDLTRAEAMVGTPGRVLDHLKQGTLRLGSVKWVVLDEADRMLDMGFINDVEKILSHTPKDRQTMLFSATIPPEIRHIIARFLRNPTFVKTESYVDKSLLRQVYYETRQEEKFSLLTHLLKSAVILHRTVLEGGREHLTKERGVSMVFCTTRRHVDVLSKNLAAQGVNAIAIHGGLQQNARLAALARLNASDGGVLVATDVAARGLDIRNVTHIYNFDVPKSSSDYIHRIGRTARAGAEGDAITLVTSADYADFKEVLKDRSLEIKRAEVPTHEHLEYIARPGRNGRERPSGISRKGKPKSVYSNTFSKGDRAEPRESDGPRHPVRQNPHKGYFKHDRDFHSATKTLPVASHPGASHGYPARSPARPGGNDNAGSQNVQPHRPAGGPGVHPQAHIVHPGVNRPEDSRLNRRARRLEKRARFAQNNSNA